MICSVLIPSRKRPEGLTKAVYTLMQTVSDRNNIEILIRFDDDDKTAKQWTSPYPNVRTFFGPRGRGYRDLHYMYRELAGHAKGHYLWVFNDDAYVALGKKGEFCSVRAHEYEPPRNFEEDATPWDLQLIALRDMNLPTQHIVQPQDSKYGCIEGGVFPLFTKKCADEWRAWTDPIDTNAHKNVVDRGGKTYYLPGVLAYHERASEEEQYRHQCLD